MSAALRFDLFCGGYTIFFGVFVAISSYETLRNMLKFHHISWDILYMYTHPTISSDASFNKEHLLVFLKLWNTPLQNSNHWGITSYDTHSCF